MERTYDRRSETVDETRPTTSAGAAPAEARNGSRLPQVDATAHPDHRAADPATHSPSYTLPSAARAPSNPWRKWLLLAGVVVGLAVGGYFVIPQVETMLAHGLRLVAGFIPRNARMNSSVTALIL
jgi:hypothetical protein